MKKMDMDKKKNHRSRRKIPAAFLAVFLVASAALTPVYAASGLDRFSDAKSHWASASLEKAVEEGVLNGSD